MAQMQLSWFNLTLLLLLLLRSGWSQLRTALRSHGRVQLPNVGGHVVRLLVGRVWRRVGSLWSSLRVCHRAGWRLQSCVPSHLRGSSQACAGGPALLGRGCRGSQNPHGRHGRGGGVGYLSRRGEVGLRLVLRLGESLGVIQGVHSLALLPCLLLHGGRVGLVRWSWGVSLILLASGCT